MLCVAVDAVDDEPEEDEPDDVPEDVGERLGVVAAPALDATDPRVPVAEADGSV